MRNLFFTLIFGCIVFNLDAQSFIRVNGQFQDAVYWPSEDKILAVTNNIGTQGNSLCRINPSTGEIEACYFIGSNPSALALTHDEKYVYVALSGLNGIVRFNLVADSVDLRFSTGGEDDFLGPFYAEDILPVRNNSNQLVVALRNACCSPRHEGVALFDNGVQQGFQTPDHTGSNSITYTDVDNIIIGYNNETTDFGLRRMAVSSNGIVGLSQQQIFDGFEHTIEYNDREVVSTSGQRVTLSNGMATNGGAFNFNNALFSSKAVEILPTENEVVFLQRSGFQQYKLTVFDRTTSALLEEILYNMPFPVDGELKELFAWEGRASMAFVTQDQELVIVQDCISSITQRPPAPMPVEGEIPCIGTSYLIEAPDDMAALGSIRWNTGDTGQQLSVTEPGEYTYEVLDQNACASPVSTSLAVSFMDPPQMPSIFYNEASNTLASSYPGANSWYLNGVLVAETDNAFFEPQESGFYTVVARNPCPSIPSSLINVMLTGVNNPELDAALTLYPNPAEYLMNIKISGIPHYEVSLLDMYGRSLWQGKNSREIRLDGFPEGNYILRVTELQNGLAVHRRFQIVR